MFRQAAFLSGVVLFLFTAVVSSQQPPPDRPGGFGPPGFGPPGGGFRGGFGPPGMMRGSLLGLAALPEVQKELSLSDAQVKQVEQLMGELREQMQAVFQEFNPFQQPDLPPPRR